MVAAAAAAAGTRRSKVEGEDLNEEENKEWTYEGREAKGKLRTYGYGIGPFGNNHLILLFLKVCFWFPVFRK